MTRSVDRLAVGATAVLTVAIWALMADSVTLLIRGTGFISPYPIFTVAEALPYVVVQAAITVVVTFVAALFIRDVRKGTAS